MIKTKQLPIYKENIITDGVSNSYVVTHNLNIGLDSLIVQIRDFNTNEIIICDLEKSVLNDLTEFTIKTDSPLHSGTITVTVK